MIVQLFNKDNKKIGINDINNNGIRCFCAYYNRGNYYFHGDNTDNNIEALREWLRSIEVEEIDIIQNIV